MVPLRIHLPPSSTDIEADQVSRDQRDLTDEILSQAQIMYNIISSTTNNGIKSKIYGQRHLSFEIVAQDGLIYYYVVAPIALVEVIKQAISTAYPAARLEKTERKNIFNTDTSYASVMGGEFTLKKEYAYPILTYKESRQDVSRSFLNALSSLKKGDGAAIQILIRPADESWINKTLAISEDVKNTSTTKAGRSRISWNWGEMLELLWKPPQSSTTQESMTTSNSSFNSEDQTMVEAIADKVRYPGFETLIRVIVASESNVKAKSIAQNIIASFALFNSTKLNGFKYNQAKNVDELVTAYILRFFPQNIKDNILNSLELATIFHLPSQKDIPTSQLKRQSVKQVDGPTELASDGLFLGYNEFRGVKKAIKLTTSDRRRHTYFIGQTGTGKSVLLENLAYQDIMDGRGLAFIDPHGDSVERILGMIPRNRVQDVVYFNPGDLDNPIGLNLFEFKTDDQKDFLIQECIQMLYKLYDPTHSGIMGPRFENWFRNAALPLMADPNGSSFIDIPQMFNNPEFANYKLQFVTDKTVLDFWHKEMAMMPESAKGEVLGWFASKFGAFLSNEMMRNVIGQTKSGFDIRDLMDNKKILLINLTRAKIGELNAAILGMIFVMKFQLAAMSRVDIPEDQREDFCLFVDEFQNFATDSFESILSEARKYRLNLIVANQFMTQLTDKIREGIIGNVGTIISGRIGLTDAELLQKRFQPTFNAEDLTRLPNYQTITTVMINNAPSNPFSMNLIPPVGKYNPELSSAVKRLSAAKYGRDRAVVSQEIFARLSVVKKAPINDSLGANALNDTAGQVEVPTPTESKKDTSSQTQFLDKWLKKRASLEQELSTAGGASTTGAGMPIQTKVSIKRLSNYTQSNIDDTATNLKINAESDEETVVKIN